MQTAPWPTELERIVEAWRYKPGWAAWLHEHYRRDVDPETGRALSQGLTLFIRTAGPDTYHPEVERPVHHLFPVPPATYDEQSWRAWMLARVIDVETHEACEWFQQVTPGKHILRDGTDVPELVQRPFAPNHGPGRDPYTVFHYATNEQRRTSFRGDLNPA